MKIKQNSHVLREHVKLNGAKILDVGCGDGALVRSMTRNGAHVIGLEVSEAQLASARAHPLEKDEQYLEGSALDLPFDDSCFDNVIFFNSLHHVPVTGMPIALKEAARVLVEGGMIYICEPIAEGPHFEMMRPVDDETEVRAAAYEAIKSADQAGLEQITEGIYTHMILRKSYEAFRDKIIAPDPHRAAIFAERKDEIEASFHALSTKTEKGHTFAQPMRVSLLRKTS
ncbi:MAG: class I SAM-dependent methyltransferase [Rhodospirillales bacterium]|nr:class I SAM-dependent methyltransferase [Rhodospirillales bacterium]